MLGIKTRIIKNLEKRLLAAGLSSAAPGKIEGLLLQKLLIKKLKQDAEAVNLQNPVASQVNSFVRQIIKKTAAFMPNNLGNWSIKKPYSLSTHLESELIKFLKRKYHCEEDIAGHFGSGSTEGNIYAAWLGRNFLQKKLRTTGTDKIILLKSSLAHYSIDKAADLTGIKLTEISIKANEFNIDETELSETIHKLYQKGYRGFLIPLTLGYTVTGTDDDYVKISQLVTKFQKKHKESHFFLWLDAAFSGISKIYTEANFAPLRAKNIQLITADFHKALAVPYPASFMLYRSSLLSLIAKKIPYIDQFDTTLLGSRSGISIINSWMTLALSGERKIRQMIKHQVQQKNRFLQQFVTKQKSVQIINNQTSLQACLASKNKDGEKLLQEQGLKKTEYNLLVKSKRGKIFLYKLYFIQQVKN